MAHMIFRRRTLASIVLFAAALVARGTGADEGLLLARDGASEYVVVQSDDATEAEAYAAQELTNFLHRATGAFLPVVTEATHAGGPAIYLGHTAFAAQQGIAFDSLGQEEWVVRAVDNDLILSGGRPRGTLYAVYEFLETQLGIRFLDARAEYVPKTDVLSVPADWRVQAKPAFSRREMMNGRGLPFDVRLRINSFANAWRETDARYGYSIKYGRPYTTHTIPRYIEEFPDAFDKDEYFALNERGNRYRRQVCMSHPDVRRIMAVTLREYIQRDRETIRSAGSGAPFPTYYALIPDDGRAGKCVCEGCMSLAARYDSYAGVVLDFVNDIAADIAVDYPDLVLVTSAYTYYRDIPTGIRPADNVMVSIAQLGAEFTTVPKRDTLRGMLHPLNAKARAEWEAWAAISPRLGVHDYWTPWQHPFVWPYAMVRATAETLAFYRRCGLEHFFVEAALSSYGIYSFADLQYYVGARLMLDPHQPVEPLIEEFTTLYYGPAAPPMRQLLNYIERRQEEEPGYLAAVAPRERTYFDRAFFVETDALLREAETLAGEDAEIVARVRQERLAFDETLLHLWNELADGGAWPFDRDAVVERLEGLYQAARAKYGTRPLDPDRIAYLRDMPPIPERFEGRTVIDLCGPLLRLAKGANRPIPRGRTDDPEAATGRTWRLEEYTWQEGRSAEHERAPEFGLLDQHQDPRFLVQRVLAPEEIPDDERYHWYFVGRALGSATLYFYAHHSWVFDHRLQMTHNPALPDPRHYDVFVSLKLEGPAYVPGSERENAFSVDRLILVEVRETEEVEDREGM